MNSLNTVYFPGTDIYSIRQYPIFLLFQKLHLIQPVEDGPADSGVEPSDNFIKSGFCQVHTPCPLGENRDRFLHLVTDIRNRRDDYAAQLSSLTLAAMGGWSKPNEDSERDIINSLYTPRDLEEEARKEEKVEKLWQARLVLAIGEILDREEEEIAVNLAMLDDDQAGLFKELQGESDSGEEDSPFAELLQVESNLGSAHLGNIKKRFKSWKTLFVEGNMEECEIFLTSSQDAGDLLLELYEKKTNISPQSFVGPELPGLVGRDSTEAYETISKFVEKKRGLLSRIHDMLGEFSGAAELSREKLKETTSREALLQQWHEELEADFPIKQFGRIQVRIYIFPGLTCSTLIGKSSTGTGKPSNGLLIVAD